MKHKYVFSKDTTTGEVLIREHAELNKDLFSPVCETVCGLDQFEKAFSQGPAALMAEMRTQNFYPPSSFFEKIIQGISDMISSGGQEIIEIYCDDADYLTRNLNSHDTFEEIEEDEDESLDEFIDEDLPDTFDGDVKNGDMDSSDIDMDDDVSEEENG